MKYILGLVVIVALVAGGWYIANNTMPQEADTSAENEMSDMNDMESEEHTTTSEVSANVDLVVDENAKVFNVSGHNFAYDMEEIRVEEGDTVVINFTSTDGFHDWVVDEFNAATERVSTGNSSSVTFVADAAGTYEFYCSVGTHRQQGMIGTLIIE